MKAERLKAIPLTSAEIDEWRSATEPGPAINLHRIVLRRLIATIDALSAELEALGDGVQPALERFRLRAEIERLSSQAPLQVSDESKTITRIVEAAHEPHRVWQGYTYQECPAETHCYPLIKDFARIEAALATPRGET